jgi:hypothetical protein
MANSRQDEVLDIPRPILAGLSLKSHSGGAVSYGSLHDRRETDKQRL